MNASQDKFIPCEGGCSHSQDEHDAFDSGVVAGQLDADSENPFDCAEQDALWLAWESGKSVGIINMKECQ